MTPERYWKHDLPAFDECHNAFLKPKKPVSISILDHLHKRSDYESGASIFDNLPGRIEAGEAEGETEGEAAPEAEAADEE